MKVVLFAFRPPPPLLSAALPLKLTGTVPAWKVLPFAGAVTEAIVGNVPSTTTPLDNVVVVEVTLQLAFVHAVK